MRNFDRQYRLSAGQAGGSGFEIGTANPMALHINFKIEKSEVSNPNSAKISIWNLAPQSLAVLDKKDCVVTLKAGYGSRMPLLFVGEITGVITSEDGADRKTEITARDSRVPLRDTYSSMSYLQRISSKTVLEDIAGEMGLPIVFSEKATFIDLPNYSYVGQAKNSLTKMCQTNELAWSIQNGIIQVRKVNEPITARAYLISSDTGLIGVPKRLTIGEKNVGNAPSNSSGNKSQEGWEIVYFLNGAIGVNDLVRLESKIVTGEFRVSKLSMEGDNFSGDWLSTAEVLEVGS